MSTTTDTAISTLSHAKYGKTAVRVFRIVREGKWHHIVEYNVAPLLEGDIDTR
jgi:urate oxidase